MMKREIETVYCGTCGKVDTFYAPRKIDARDKQYASEEELMEELKKREEELQAEPFFNDFVTGRDNIEYLVNFCSSECYASCPDAADIPDDRKKIAMDWNEKEDFKISL